MRFFPFREVRRNLPKPVSTRSISRQRGFTASKDARNFLSGQGLDVWRAGSRGGRQVHQRFRPRQQACRGVVLRLELLLLNGVSLSRCIVAERTRPRSSGSWQLPETAFLKLGLPWPFSPLQLHRLASCSADFAPNPAHTRTIRKRGILRLVQGGTILGF